MTAHDITELREWLEKLEGNRPDSMGICTMWYRNPDGPEASAALASLQAENEALTTEIERLREDKALLDTLRDESWDLRCFAIPTGGDDADIGWRVVGRWMDEPQERVVGEAYIDEPRAAIRAALQPKDQSNG